MRGAGMLANSYTSKCLEIKHTRCGTRNWSVMGIESVARFGMVQQYSHKG